MATSAPVPMAMPRSAWASAGASLIPSPTIATIAPPACSRSIAAALSAGRTSATIRSGPIPTCGADGLRGLPPVPGQHPDLDAGAPQPLHRLGGAGLDGVGEADDADRAAVARDPGGGGRPEVAAITDVDALLGEVRGGADQDRRAVDDGADPATGRRLEVAGVDDLDAALGCVSDDRLGQRVLAATLGRRREPQQLVLGDPRRG